MLRSASCKLCKKGSVFVVGESYKSRKNEVLEIYENLETLIKDIKAYVGGIGLPDPTENLTELLSGIRKTAQKVYADKFRIMVAGEAKSGKSTFINAYLGVELLPMDVKQCTSAIVTIRYGERFSVTATYADGRKVTMTGDEEARAFLRANAALNDDYRDIPVPTINTEILVKAGRRCQEKGSRINIPMGWIEDMLKEPEVQAANIHNLPDYNQRILRYIEEKKNSWQDIVTAIEVQFPFREEGLRGIEIIDSPGVCARGGVSDITNKYIQNADAVIFLKPLSGQALESSQFNLFMRNVSVERNKNALFLILTRAANVNGAELRRLEDEVYKQFGNLDKRNILLVDSKAECYANAFAAVPDVDAEFKRLRREKKLDDFVKAAYYDDDDDDPVLQSGGGAVAGDVREEDILPDAKNAFISRLRKKSNFGQVYATLDSFGRNAHFLLLASLMDAIQQLYVKLWANANDRLNMFKQKAEDPMELARKIAELKQEMDMLQNKMSRGVDDVVRRFRGEDGIINRQGEAAVADFKARVAKISPDAKDALEELERLSLQKMDDFTKLTTTLQKQVVAEFDATLVALSDKSKIPYVALKPDFTAETFKKLKESTKSKAEETHHSTSGILCFEETHSYSTYSQNKHFGIIKKDILKRLDSLKRDLAENLEDFVENIRTRYIQELSNNAAAKKREMDAIMDAKTTAEQNVVIIRECTDMLGRIGRLQEVAERCKGGVDKIVQRNY